MNKCKGKCPALAVIKTTKGYIFGGYTIQLWKEGEVKDQNAFVFSIDKKKKYNIKLPEHATGFSINYLEILIMQLLFMIIAIKEKIIMLIMKLMIFQNHMN